MNIPGTFEVAWKAGEVDWPVCFTDKLSLGKAKEGRRVRKDPCSPGHKGLQSLSSKDMVPLLQSCLEDEMRGSLNEFLVGGGGRKTEGHFHPPWLELQHRDPPAHLPREAEPRKWHGDS